VLKESLNNQLVDLLKRLGLAIQPESYATHNAMLLARILEP